MTRQLIEMLEHKITQDIPLTQHMGLKVKYYDGEKLCLAADLQKNINHRQTAFGGSITSLATLSGWGLLYLKLYELNIYARIVIQEGHTKYLKPVTKDFEAICSLTDINQFNRFIEILHKKHIARISLKSIIKSQEDILSEFTGQFVAILLL